MKKRFSSIITAILFLQGFVFHHAAGQTRTTVFPFIQWDSATRIRVSAPGARYSGYARMIQLHERSLFTIYEQDGSTVGVTSNDLGKTWSAPIIIAQKEQGINMAVPDMLQLKDHTLLAFYNPRPFQKDTARRFAIRVKRSTDGGKTWGDEQTLYRAGHEFENGCWEPAAIQLPSGEIQLYFANEGPYTHSNEQNISLLRSRDNGRTWTTEPEIACFRPGKRDGMPVPLLLNNGKDVVFSIEDNGIVNFKPYIIANSLKENWKQTVNAEDKHRQYALKENIADSIYAGAPFIRQLKTGETILSYQGAEGRTNSMERFAEMKVVIGDAHARTFTSKSVPFTIPANKRGLWNSLCILDDDTIIALTSTNAYGNNTEVWMIKGKLQRKK